MLRAALVLSLCATAVPAFAENRDWIAASMACQNYGPVAAGDLADMCLKLRVYGINIALKRNLIRAEVEPK